jgi:hypothetical protein
MLSTKFLHYLALFLVKKRQLFSRFFWKKYLKNQNVGHRLKPGKDVCEYILLLGCGKSVLFRR